MTNLNTTEKQNERVLDRLRKGPVTSCELIRDLDIIRPSARIYDLRRDGHQIVTAWDWDRVNGTEHRVGRYVLLTEPDPGKAKGPTGTRHTDEAQKQKQPAQYTVIREVIAIAVIGALLAVLFVDSVVGMSGQFGPTPEVGFTLAGVGSDGR